MNAEVLQTVYNPDRTRRLHVIRRENGTFGFEEEYFSTYEFEMCWVPLTKHFSVFDLAEAALREARGRLDWLPPLED